MSSKEEFKMTCKECGKNIDKDKEVWNELVQEEGFLCQKCLNKEE